MDHVTIAEKNVAERYLMGKLSASEEARFVEHYLDCPECLDQLELTRRLYAGLQEIAAEEGARTAVRSALLSWLLGRGRVLQVALVAGLLATIALPWAWLGSRAAKIADERQRFAGELTAALAPQAGTLIYSLSPERSTSSAEPNTRITLAAAPEWVLLVVQLPPNPSPADYRVRLLKTSGETLWQSERLAPDAAGRITFSVHSTWLEPADYTVELEAFEAGVAITTSFAFRVRRTN